MFVLRNLQDLGESARTFSQAVQLYQWAYRNSLSAATTPDDKGLLRSWALMGAKIGAIEIYTFKQCESGLMTALSKCPTLLTHIDKKLLKPVWSLFSKQFPEFESIRVAAAHGAEIYNRPEKFERHAHRDSIDSQFISKPSGPSLIIASSMVGDDFTCTYEGKLISYPVTAESANILDTIRDQVWLIFQKGFDDLRCEIAGSC